MGKKQGGSGGNDRVNKVTTERKRVELTEEWEQR